MPFTGGNKSKTQGISQGCWINGLKCRRETGRVGGRPAEMQSWGVDGSLGAFSAWFMLALPLAVEESLVSHGPAVSGEHPLVSLFSPAMSGGHLAGPASPCRRSAGWR